MLLSYKPLHLEDQQRLQEEGCVVDIITRKGLTTPLAHRVARCCYLCAGAVYVVLLGSPTGSITLVSYLREIPTAAVLHHPSLGKYRRSSSRHQKEFLAPLPGRIFNINQVPNHKSHLLAIYITCHLPLVFLSLTSQIFAVLFASLFSFAVFLPDLFLSAILL